MRTIPLGLLAVLLLPSPTAGQWDRPPEAGGRIASLGQPRRSHWQVGLVGGPLVNDGAARLMLRSYAGVTRDLLSPVVGVGAGSLEVYAGLRDAVADGGARALLRIPYFSVGAGVDYNIRDARFDFVVTAHSPIRRGGIVMRGGQVRADWYPGRAHSFTLGLAFPVGDPLVARGRPLRDYVMVSGDFHPDVPYVVRDAAMDAVVDTLRVSAEWVRRFVAPFLDQDGRHRTVAEARTARYLEELRGRTAIRGVDDEVRHFHAATDQLFALAAGDAGLGMALAARAREVLLDEVILPYNRLLGQKKRRDALDDLNTVARGRFAREVTASRAVPAPRLERVFFAFQALTRILEDVRQTASREWDDPRLAWLPLQYALLPEDHDEAEELDALVERATGLTFADANRVRYVANLQFHWELLRMIRETRNYHVLWIHDFPAITRGALDWAAMSQVVDGYLATLADRVEAYDRTGHLPVFFIFLDQHYYEGRRSRLLMSVLEDPLNATLDLPRGVEGDLAPLVAAQERLRAAVAHSQSLQAEARHYGQDWLRNRVRVHVSITNRPDASFWSGTLVSTLFGYPDNIMRDHRKVAFRDVDEEHPDEGMAIFTGMGVGAAYLGPSWDDRSLIVQGPVLLQLREAARVLLLSQGITADALPMPLRAGTPSAGATAAGSGDTRAMLLVNGTGYLPKLINVGKATLYSLLPRGSVLKIPDSLWNSTFFAGLLTGACLRGASVSIVAPAADNAPSAGFPQMSRASELFVRLLMVRDILREPLERTGGAMHPGLYALPSDSAGFTTRTNAWLRQLADGSVPRDLMPFGADLRDVVAGRAGAGAAAGAAPAPPRLHHKVQFAATGPLWRAIREAEEWPAFMDTYLRYREATYDPATGTDTTGALIEELARLAERIFARAADQPGAGAWAVVGSQNQDYRGMFMDGEFGLLYSGAGALTVLLDLAFLEGTVTWVEDRETLERLIPPVGEMARRFARVAKDAI